MSDTEAQATEGEPDKLEMLTAALKETAKAKPQAKPTGDPPAQPAAEEEPPAEAEPDAEEEEPDTPAVRDDGKPFTAKDQAALQTALKAARADAKAAAAQVKKLTDATGGKDAAQLVADADTAAAAKWKPLMVKAAARASLTEAGLTLPEDRADEAFARALRLVDLDALTITDGGLVEGLAEQVESIRADFPNLFGGTTRKAPTPRLQAADRKAAPKPQTSAEKLAAAFFAG